MMIDNDSHEIIDLFQSQSLDSLKELEFYSINKFLQNIPSLL